MKIKTDLRPAIEKLLKIKEVVCVFFPSEDSGFPEKKTGIGEKIWKDAKTGEMKQKPVVLTLKVEIMIKQKYAKETIKAETEIAKIMKDVPYDIIYKI